MGFRSGLLTPSSHSAGTLARSARPAYDKPLDPEQIPAVKDESLDFSDIPELDENFWREARLVEPDRTEQISLRVRRSVLQWFKRPGKGYQTRINRVLETYVQAQREAEQRRVD